MSFIISKRTLSILVVFSVCVFFLVSVLVFSISSTTKFYLEYSTDNNLKSKNNNNDNNDLKSFSNIEIEKEFGKKSFFGTDEEYQCFGTCYCEINSNININNKRRSSSSIPIIKKGMSYLFVAVSSTIAYNLAKKHFEKECEKELSFECSHLTNIKSEIQSCEKTSSSSSTKEEEEEEKKTLKTDIRRYLCKGTCRRKSFKTESTKKQAEKSQIRCSSLTTSGEVEIDTTGILGKRNGPNPNTEAIRKFSLKLTKFCKKESQEEWLYVGIRKSGRYVGHKYEHKRKMSVCCATKPYQSIRCRQIYPRYKDQRGSNRIQW